MHIVCTVGLFERRDVGQLRQISRLNAELRVKEIIDELNSALELSRAEMRRQNAEPSMWHLQEAVRKLELALELMKNPSTGDECQPR